MDPAVPIYRDGAFIRLQFLKVAILLVFSGKLYRSAGKSTKGLVLLWTEPTEFLKR